MTVKVSVFLFIVLATFKLADSVSSSGTLKRRGASLPVTEQHGQMFLGEQHMPQMEPEEPAARADWPWQQQRRQHVAWETLVKLAPGAFLVQEPRESHYSAKFPAEVYAVNLAGKFPESHDVVKRCLSSGSGACLDLKMFVEKIQPLLPHMNKLEVLDLGSNDLGPSGIKELVGKLHLMTRLKVLKLYDNKIGDDGVQHLAFAIPFMSSLQTLDLSNNNIGDMRLQMLADALSQKSVVQELDLSDNKISSEGAKKLFELLPKTAGLQRLDLSHNSIRLDAKTALRKEKSLKHASVKL